MEIGVFCEDRHDSQEECEVLRLLSLTVQPPYDIGGLDITIHDIRMTQRGEAPNAEMRLAWSWDNGGLLGTCFKSMTAIMRASRPSSITRVLTGHRTMARMASSESGYRALFALHSDHMREGGWFSLWLGISHSRRRLRGSPTDRSVISRPSLWRC